MPSLRLEPEPDPAIRLEQQLRLLQRESHLLHGWSRAEWPALFAQQVHNRAVMIGDHTLREQAGRRLVDLQPNLPHAALLWRASNESPDLLRVLTGHESRVTTVAVTGDGRHAVSGAHDGTVRVWDLAGCGAPQILIDHEDWVQAVAMRCDGRYAVSGATDGTVRVWDLDTWDCVAIVPTDASASSLALAGPDPLLVVGDWIGGVSCYALRGLGGG